MGQIQDRGKLFFLILASDGDIGHLPLPFTKFHREDGFTRLPGEFDHSQLFVQ